GKVFDEINNMVGDDRIAKDRIQSMVITAIKNTSKATLDSISKQDKLLKNTDKQIIRLNKTFEKFKADTTGMLEIQQQEISALQSDLGILGDSVSSIDKRLQTQEQNAGFVTDFVFDKMDPGAKADALKAGFLSDRFACSP